MMVKRRRRVKNWMRKEGRNWEAVCNREQKRTNVFPSFLCRREEMKRRISVNKRTRKKEMENGGERKRWERERKKRRERRSYFE